MVCIKTSDEKIIDIDEVLIKNSILLKNLIEDTDTTDDCTIPISNIRNEIFDMILTCLKADDKKSYLSTLDRDVIIEFVIALDFLNIEELLNLCCKEIALRISNMNIEDMKAYLGISL